MASSALCCSHSCKQRITSSQNSKEGTWPRGEGGWGCCRYGTRISLVKLSFPAWMYISARQPLNVDLLHLRHKGTHLISRIMSPALCYVLILLFLPGFLVFFHWCVFFFSSSWVQNVRFARVFKGVCMCVFFCIARTGTYIWLVKWGHFWKWGHLGSTSKCYG